MASTINSEQQLREYILALEKENAALKDENKKLKKLIEFHRGDPVVELIREWTEGTLTVYKARYDITTKKGTRLEIKYSKVHTLENGTERWTWSSILGQNQMKQFDFLVLAGLKNERYEKQKQYPDLPYVLFLVPRENLDKIASKSLALTTNLNSNRADNQKLRLLKPYLVHSRSQFERFKQGGGGTSL